ncbi:hypothetical protein, partial [Acinetobacter sp. NigerLNRRAM0016]
FPLRRQCLTFDRAKVTKPFVAQTQHPCCAEQRGDIHVANHVSKDSFKILSQHLLMLNVINNLHKS